MFAKKSQYGFQAAYYISLYAVEEHLISPEEIATSQNLPLPFLRKILQILAKQKILKSIKGPHGGFGLAKAASEITLMDIYLAIEGFEVLNNCVIGFTECTSERPCPFHNAYSDIRNQMYAFLASTTLEDVCNDIKARKSFISYTQ
ncbi:MAG: Rrf2 family transcriptional regulator [Chitinophagales bacterium]